MQDPTYPRPQPPKKHRVHNAFLGFFGGRRFYLGKPGRGSDYVFPRGLLTIGAWPTCSPGVPRLANTRRQ